MSQGVEFEEDSFSYAKPKQNVGSSELQSHLPANLESEPTMVKWLIKHGFSKSPKMAQFILLGVVILNIVITYIIIKYFL